MTPSTLRSPNHPLDRMTRSVVTRWFHAVHCCRAPRHRSACRWAYLALVKSLGLFVSLLALVGCAPNPDDPPQMSELAGTWIPTTHTTRPPTQFLVLTTNLTFVASNFPVSPSIGQTALVSDTGAWELSSSYAAFLVKFRAKGGDYSFRVVGSHSPFVLATSIYDDDERLKARRLEDHKK
jgi:hypothetical protein